MNWDCTQLEQRLGDYLEGQLARADLAAADAHARACPRCAEWYDARRATLWLQEIEPLEAPPGLETRILALTVAPPPQESFWAVLDRGWRLLLQPRFAFGLTAALVSLALGLNALGFSPARIQAADLNPANLYRAINRQAHLTYARGARFVNDLRLVYEFRSRLEELEPEAEPPATPAPQTPGQKTPKGDDKMNNPTGEARNYWLLAKAGNRREGLVRLHPSLALGTSSPQVNLSPTQTQTIEDV